MLRSEFPDLAPWAHQVPGMRSNGTDDPANTVRRAFADADNAIAIRAMTENVAVLTELVRQSIEAPRFAAAGPFQCTAPTR